MCVRYRIGDNKVRSGQVRSGQVQVQVQVVDDGW